MVAVVQGDIIKLNLNPKTGHEQQGYRPYICLSNDKIYQTSGISILAPISSTKREYPLYRVLDSSLKTVGKILLDQLVAVDTNARQYQYVESVTPEYLEGILEITKLIFEK